MKVQQRKWTSSAGWEILPSLAIPLRPQLVLAFGSRDLLSDADRFSELASLFPDSHIITCSTAGEILNTTVTDESLVVTAIEFEKTILHVSEIHIESFRDSTAAGEKICENLLESSLRHIFILADGQLVNGSALIRGMSTWLPQSISVTGGLAGDGSRFKKTLVGLNSPPSEGNIVAVGFYGNDMKIGYGSVGG
jgi:hypothetical protein